jgi:Flp pilus assembly protein TadG
LKTLRQHTRARLKDERGVAALEFAIVSQLLLILLYGMLNYGFVFALDHNISQAAAEAARATIAQPTTSTDAQLITYAQNTARNVLSFSAAKTYATVTAEVINCPADATVRCIHVTISYDYANHPLIPAFLLGGLLPSTVSSESTVELG